MSELTDSIVAAFADNEYPGDTRLTVYGDSPLDCDETRRLLIGRSWQDFPAAEFIQGDTPFPDLSPEAFHYYMPALLLASLDRTFDLNSDLAHSIVFYLSPRGAFEEGEFGYDDREGFQQRMAQFTPTQREVMAETLKEYVRAYCDDKWTRETIDFLTRAN
jgi:hypothetical protein